MQKKTSSNIQTIFKMCMSVQYGNYKIIERQFIASTPMENKQDDINVSTH